MNSKKATIYEYAKMCKKISECEDCPLGSKNNGDSVACSFLMRADTDKANEIILKWCEEHPIKTRQSEFLKMFPNADISCEGYLEIEPCNIDKRLFDNETCTPRDCDECKKEYWLAEVGE